MALFPFTISLILLGGDREIPGKLIYADTQGLQKILPEDFTRSYWLKIIVFVDHMSTSMIINYFNAICISILLPLETNAPLFIDADSVLTFSLP
jgi:hypothetical protein